MIAVAGPDLPHEVLLAAGRHGGALPFQPDRATPWASRWLESKFMPWAPAVLESWAEGAYDGFDAVLFSRADDTSQRLYYYIGELQRRGEIGGPEPLVFDVAKIRRETSLDHTVAQVRALCERLGVADEALDRAIEQANSQRRQHDTPTALPVCLLRGTPPPDDRLRRVAGRAGFAVHGATLAETWSALGAPVTRDLADPAAAIARQIHASGEGSRSFADPAAALEHAIGQSGCRAVVMWLTEEDEARSWALPEQRVQLVRLGMPHLILTRRDWLGRDGAAEEIAAFLATLPAREQGS